MWVQYQGLWGKVGEATRVCAWAAVVSIALGAGPADKRAKAPPATAPAAAELPEAGTSWQSRAGDAILQGNQFEIQGKDAEAVAQWQKALAIFPATLTPTEAERKKSLVAAIEAAQLRLKPVNVFQEDPAPRRPVAAAGQAIPVAGGATRPVAVAPSATTGPTSAPAGIAVGSLGSPKLDAKDPVQRAFNLITDGRYDEARKLLEPVVKANANNGRAQLALGYSLLKLGSAKDAAKSLEEAVRLMPGDRTAVVALASALFNDNAMRSARILREYMSRPGVPPDEELQNDFGAALVKATQSMVGNVYFEDCRQFYLQYDERLDQLHGANRKRWGTQWEEATLADKKWQTVRRVEKRLEDAQREAGRSTVMREKAFHDLADYSTGFGLVPERQKKKLRDNLAEAKKVEVQKHKELAKAQDEMSKTEQPPFPSQIPVPPFWQIEGK